MRYRYSIRPEDSGETGKNVQVSAYWVEHCRITETGESYFRIMRQRQDDPRSTPTVLRNCMEIGLAFGAAGILAADDCDQFNVPCYETLPDWANPNSGLRDRMAWVAYRLREGA